MKGSTATLILCGMISLNAQAGHHTPMIEFVGEAQIPTGTQFENTEIGGLSGIDYDAAQDLYVAISDDRAQINHARYYELSIDLTDGYLNDGDISFIQVTEILDSGDFPFAPASLDPEAIRNNLAFESLSFNHDRIQVITATENALL